MRNKTLIAIAVAACIATPLSFAQSRGAGGPPVGVGGGNAGARAMDRGAIGVDTASRAAMQRTAEIQTRTQFGAEQRAAAQAAQNQTAIDARARAEAKADARVDTDVDTDDMTKANANATFGQDTAARAKLQGEADAETRKTFGATQSEAAKAKNDATDDVDDGIDDDVDDTDTDVDTGEEVDGDTSSTFGQDTAARAKLQREADPETRKTFGATQSEAAKAKNDATDGDDDPTDDGDDE